VGHNFLSDWSEAERSKITPKKVAKTPKRHTKSVAEPSLTKSELNASYPDSWTWDNGVNVAPV
jgi:hypothetical protein